MADDPGAGFINKPQKGWLHSDQLLTKEGVSYTVRYIGCLDVNTSMKSLDFDTRSLIAKECINQVCEAAGLKSIDRRHKVDRRVIRILGLRPRLENAGSDVLLTITSTMLKLTSLDQGSVIAVHEMPNISFASGGDATMLDFVAYVAKDSIVGRACFVLECGSGLAQDVITTVGQAFELRFKEYLQKSQREQQSREFRRPADPEYYNDLPGKIPPDIKRGVGGGGRRVPTLTLPVNSDMRETINLIDFEAPTPPAFGPNSHTISLEEILTADQEDPFDFDIKATTTGEKSNLAIPAEDLKNEPWFHGPISRSDAEELVMNDGDFLVRESQSTPGQYVLTGQQSGAAKHLLLVDSEGVVRTKDRTFSSVSHLIRHHRDSSRPIISVESMILLRHPVNKLK